MNLAKKFSPLKLSSLDFQIVQEKWRISGTGCLAVGVNRERVWEHLNGGWIPVFSLVQSARHGTNMAGAIIYAPHLHVRDFCQGYPRTCIRAVWKNGQMPPRGCALHLSKCPDSLQMPSSCKKCRIRLLRKISRRNDQTWSNKIFYIKGKKNYI